MNHKRSTMLPQGAIIEFIRQGAYMKVSAVDPVSGFEVSIVGDPSAGKTYLEEQAIRKLERMLKQHQQLDQASARILEINPDHALIKRMTERSKDDGEVSGDMKDAALMLLDQARIIEGEAIPDPAAFSRRMASFMARGL